MCGQPRFVFSAAESSRKTEGMFTEISIAGKKYIKDLNMHCTVYWELNINISFCTV